MKILLIMPLSYGYNESIISALNQRGDEVVFIPDFDESITKRFLRKFISLEKIQNNYIRSKISVLKEKDFDLVVIIRGYWYDDETISWIKNRYNKAKIVLYQWDPISISHLDTNALGLFDCLYSFDKSDCKTYGMNYLPLFYKKKRDEILSTKDLPNFDFSFVGSGHSQRLYVLGQLIQTFDQLNYSYFIRIYINRYSYLFGLIQNKPGYRNFPKKYLSFNSIPKQFSEEIVSRTRVIIDVHHPKQTGLSIRVMEVLGAGKRIITTNKTILDEPFYKDSVIGIIENCKLPSNCGELLRSSSIADVSSYELSNWIDLLMPIIPRENNQNCQ